MICQCVPPTLHGITSQFRNDDSDRESRKSLFGSEPEYLRTAKKLLGRSLH